jgi:succinate dehydrogenase / fumarate reductase flavoprotein subunit
MLKVLRKEILFFDTIIIGSGGAALSVALRLKEINSDLNVAVLSKSNPTASQTCMAQGGINAPYSEEEVKTHIEDTLTSGKGLSNKDIVEYFCSNAKNSIEWLSSLGVPFDIDDDSKLKKRKLGGTKISQAIFSQDYTGLKLIHTLFDNCIKNDINMMYNKFLLNVIVEDGISKGITCLDIETGEVIEMLAKSVVMTTGGYSAIYNGFTTNSYSTSGDGLAASLRAGAKLANMEFVQFHPTALKSSSILISESARAEGGYLLNSDNERFVDELDTRDKVAREIYNQIENGKDVFLDIRHIGLDKIESLLPQERKLCINHENLYPEKDLIPIKPVAHYSMGGIEVDMNSSTNIKGLYSCGEASCVGLHGANRLGGNSLLELVVFGRNCANSVIEYLNSHQVQLNKNSNSFINDKEFINQVFSFSNQIDFYERREFLGKIFYRNCGIIRKDINLKAVLQTVRQYQQEYRFMGIGDKTKAFNTNLIEFLEFGNMLELAEVILVCAISRIESRGSHFREDYPLMSEEFNKNSISWKEDGVLCNEFR